jgi:hypothetical protein
MATQEITGTIVLGQRVYTSLYSRGPGIVVAIHGQQDSGSVRSLGGGVVMMGGNATFDIAFKCGSFTKHLPECILRGVQWQIGEEVADADEIIDAVQFCNAHAAREKEIAEAHTARRDEERKQYAAEYKHLLKKSDKPDYSPGRLAAENIRRELKAAYPGVKFNVRSDYNSVRIRWIDGPKSKEVEKLTGKYEAGSFDGMTDSYSYNADATFADVFGDPQYVFCNRELSDAEERRLAGLVAQRFGFEVDHGTPYHSQFVKNAGEWLGTLIHREQSGYYGE